MKVAIHQPTYLPYLGFFYKVLAADVLIVFDSAQYEKGSVHNRQRIRTAQGSTWLTIPLKTSLTPFSETPISYDDEKHPWHARHWRSIEHSYGKSPYFGRHADRFARLYREGHPYVLGDFNSRIMFTLLEAFGLSKRVVFFSNLGIELRLPASAKLAEAVLRVGGSEYISGPSGARYLDAGEFTRRGLSVSLFEFEHPVYRQYHARFDGAFLPNMGAIDALFNVGALPPAAARCSPLPQ